MSPPPILDVHRASPVRGQLEPYDPRTPPGCRYVQTTDTPDELKVLLPPGTASMYEQLLKLENYELSKKPAVSWERIMEIRHLKDRMIRKCQKLAKTTMPMSKKSSRGDTFVFQTFVAPQDFRVKEMEKWFREQQKRANSLPRRTISAGQSASYELALAGPSSRRLPSTSSKQPVQRSTTNPEPPPNHRQDAYSKLLPTIQPQRIVQSERTLTPQSAALPVALNFPQIMSPPPLPVLILSQREALGLDEPEGQPPNIASLSLGPDQPTETSPSDPAGEASPRPILSRRPSCIKRDSAGDLKRVSWADNQHELDNQLSKYATAAREAQASGKWEEVQVLYLEQIAGLENLQQQVQDGLEHLRSETDHLQRIDETIRKQREALDSTFHDFELKHNLLKEKVQEALTEANYALNRHGVARELEPIHEAEH
ncbi:unnamed protein product [Cyclocybe aegerita]|uniref:Uncharacterized protein n=1 Tax=Cyclocybe aegerita TaxID=1973307 RepID=A0A8S0W7E4_CYCAE|nr:unnamed protein product [Cyclocybe aegerita]